ncbi:MAG TPA: UDP-glucose--hexose-1-phosphate uridylyltransferase [Bacteroidota bacterium]
MITDHPHRRLNPLTGDWVLVSPHRSKRPWQGKLESSSSGRQSGYDPSCYLCPGNERHNGIRNPDYVGTFVFDNDFSALIPETAPVVSKGNPLINYESVGGTCRVVCFSHRHDVTLSQMNVAEIRGVIDVWADELKVLGQQYRWVQIFENKGEIMGCSNPHPHCQIWASSSIPNEPLKEDVHQRAYLRKYKRNLLTEYLRYEKKHARRIVIENENWIVVVPFWAVWPYETLLIPRKHILRFPDLNAAQREGLADILKRLTTGYDHLFDVSFPYSMGWHGAPWAKGNYDHWQLHAHFYPPLLRSATVRKYMVGYEMLSEPQRDITPEQAAGFLRDKSNVRPATS